MRWLLPLVVFTVAASTAVAERRLAVLELRNGAQIPDREVSWLTDIVRGAAVGAPERWFVITRENVLALLPPGVELADCEGACEVETGRKVGADEVVTGEVVRVGGALKVSLKRFDTRSGRLLAAQRLSAKSVAALEGPLEKAGKALLGHAERPAPVADVGDLSDLDVGTLERYQRATRLDADADAPVIEKIRAWTELARVPRFRDVARARVKAWHAHDVAQSQRRLEDEKQRALLQAEWEKLERVLGLEVVPEAKKRGFAARFEARYREVPEAAPLIGRLRPWLSKPDPALAPEWVDIPGGELDGSYVRPFALARHEVTVAQFRACVAAGRCDEPKRGRRCTWGVPDHEQHPVNCVTRAQAIDYARWVGGRLPSEREWRHVAGPGEVEPAERAAPVCADARRSAQGVCDLLGNLREWRAETEGEGDASPTVGFRVARARY